jgi:hypothetical protein
MKRHLTKGERDGVLAIGASDYVNKLYPIIRKEAFASSEEKCQEAYEHGVEDAAVDSRNEYEARIKELEAGIKSKDIYK